MHFNYYNLLELTADLFSECQFGKSLKRLHSTDIIEISQFMTSCSVIVSLVYLERLKEINPDFLLKHSPDHIFIISVVSFIDKRNLRSSNIIFTPKMERIL